MSLSVIIPRSVIRTLGWNSDSVPRHVDGYHDSHGDGFGVKLRIGRLFGAENTLHYYVKCLFAETREGWSWSIGNEMISLLYYAYLVRSGFE